jgi:uncharacterized protein (DUF2267 family)
MKQTTFLIIAVCAAVVLAWGKAHSQEKEPESEWLRVFPCEADGAAQVRDAGGTLYPSTGPGCNTWFNWGGAGNWKMFKVKKGKAIIINALGDSGSGAVLGHVAFRLSEHKNGEWKGKLTFEGPNWNGVAPKGEPQYRLLYFEPDTDLIRIDCIKGGFYIKVYQVSQKQNKINKIIPDKEKMKVAELIKKLGANSWKEREKAQRELEKMDERILPLLEKEKDKPLLETRVRIKRIIKALTPLTSETVSEETIKKQASELVKKLADYIKANSFTCDSEPVRSLAAIGPYAVEPLLEEFDSDSEHVRAAVVLALGKLKNTGGLKTVLSALKSDKSQEVRYQAAKALVSFDTKDVRKALKAASENDKSERVCKQALESLKQIENKQKLTKKKKDK